MVAFRKPATLWMVCFALLLSVAVVGFTPASSLAQVKKLRVGILPIGDLLQIFVAQKKGFLVEMGLDAELRNMAGGAVIAPAVSSGDLDVGFSNTISIIQAHEKGFDFTFLTSGAHDAPGHRVISLIIAKGSGIKNMKDLEGKTVGVNTRRNLLELLYAAWADRQGADIQKFKFVEVPFPQMEPTMKSGSIVSAAVVEPFVTLPTAHGVAEILIQDAMTVFGPRALIASWFARRAWIDKNPKAAKDFARAIEKSSTYITEHTAEMPGIIAENTKLTADLAGKITLPEFSPSFRKSDLQSSIDLSAKYGYITKGFSADALISAFANVVP